ncbi:50S ribosomal protein L19e [archaeon]|nr:50S ribosomal protein L19e [archaeon]|tara:strand:+ start:2692 stop:3150 length:459 start_codon:yes stop_codon:yes gene_type:complete
MSLKLQKRLASSLMKISQKKIQFDQEKLSEIKDAITKVDVRKLISNKSIKKKKGNSQSKYRARKNLLQKRKGRQTGVGSRKGKKTARTPNKTTWMNKIRKQRLFLKILKDKNLISTQEYRGLYMKSKGGFFRSKRHLKGYLEEHNIIKDGKK